MEYIFSSTPICRDEIIKERRKKYNEKYRKSEKGKEAQKKAIKKYQKTEKFKQYKREYYQRKKMRQ